MIGIDIKEILDDIGIPFSIFGSVVTEKCFTKINSQVSKPFIREFFLEATMHYATQVLPGDVLVFDPPDNRHYLVTSSTPKNLGGSITQTECVLYKCNSFGSLQRNTGAEWDAQYQHNTSWTTLKYPCPALLSEVQFGAMSELHSEDIGQLTTQELKLYLPASVGIKTLDRYVVDGVNWKIGRIETHRFSGCVVCNVEEDTRE